MRDRARSSLLAVFALAAAAIWFAAGFLGGSPVQAENQARVASSVCEAHELRELQQKNPGLAIEIPKQFDTPWPTREACRSHAAAQDPSTPGPVQPIQFSHKHHAGLYQIDCQYCHSGTDRSRVAGVPAVEVCMGCHSQFPASYDELEGIRTLKQHWADKKPIEWVQIHRLPEYVKFQHRAHVRAGFACQQCHGAVETEDKVAMKDETVWWPWLLPAKTLEMGWCINCHRQNNATQDCYACHY
jgi:cytochrome c7-like protein